MATSGADGTFAQRVEARAASPPTACLRLDAKAPPRAAVTGLTLTSARAAFGAPRAGPTADNVGLVILLPWRGAEPPTVDPHPAPFASPAEELALLAASIPGFGGYYVHGQNVTVYLTDISTVDAVNPLLLAHFRRHPPKGLDAASLRLGYQPARYTYEQLVAWRDEVARTRVRGVVGVALRMDWNRVQVMARGAQAFRRVRAMLERLRIPERALMVVSPP